MWIQVSLLVLTRKTTSAHSLNIRLENFARCFFSRFIVSVAFVCGYGRRAGRGGVLIILHAIVIRRCSVTPLLFLLHSLNSKSMFVVQLPHVPSPTVCLFSVSLLLLSYFLLCGCYYWYFSLVSKWVSTLRLWAGF